MTIDFEPEETEEAVRDAMSGLCRQHCPEDLARAGGTEFPTALWAALANFGLFGLAASQDMGGAVALAAAAEVLGAAVAPGPLASAVFAAALLPEPERTAVVGGEQVAVICAPPLAPWPDKASILLETDGDRAWRLEVAGDLRRVETLAGETWGRGELRRAADLGSAKSAAAAHDVFLAGYLAGAARKLLREASAYVSNRRQFGKTLSQFQAVSQPLAEAAIQLRAATTLTRIAAHEFDIGQPSAGMNAAIACRSAQNAALRSAYVAHQAYGAMGMTVEGPVYYVSRRIRQLVNEQTGKASRVLAIEAGYLTDSAVGPRVVSI
jgi:alkylation response protein AidB-like acyl-CoA dehydrogenase